MNARPTVLIALAAWTSSARAETAAPAAAEIVKLDRAWGDAEGRGDADFVDRLLLPEYRSIGQDGKVTTKEQIVDHTRGRGPSADYQAKIAAWRAEHQMRADLQIVGTTAVLTWISTRQGSEEPVSSCDIFVLKDGGWHALYSQHSSASS